VARRWFRAANEVIAKGTAAAARLLQAKPDEVRFDNGRFIAGDRAITLQDVAREAPLDTYVWNLLDVITFPNGCHIAEVEVDPETGVVTLDRYYGVDDYGTLINPLLTLGQVHGGVGAGDRPGDAGTHRLRSGLGPVAQRFADGLCVAARGRSAGPEHHADRHSNQRQPFGVKGAGQAGAMAAPQTIICAILDALAPLGVTHIDMPATPERVWRAIQEENPGS
jgi:carbon-monoxide dehydrogenase large subunit